jgi:hypothetical protein
MGPWVGSYIPEISSELIKWDDPNQLHFACVLGSLNPNGDMFWTNGGYKNGGFHDIVW